MTTVEDAHRYFNIMAMALKIVNEFAQSLNKIYSIPEYDEISEATNYEMNQCWCADNQNKLENIVVRMQEETDMVKKVKAFVVCQWLDHKVTYMLDELDASGQRAFFSLYCLIPLANYQHCCIDSLNTNWKQTGIWINPKFEIALPYVDRDGENVKKRISNKAIFEGMNNQLNNCSYFLWNEKRYVKNIIIPKDDMQRGKGDHLLIAFAPMSDRSDLISVKNMVLERDGIKQNGEIVEPLKDAEKLKERLKNDWSFAGEVNADVFFAPELLGTELSEKNDGIYNDLIYTLSMQRLCNGENVPKLSVLPSYWHEQSNCATVVSYDGEILGVQEKNIPFVDEKNHVMEALKEKDQWTTVLIHIPRVHRIAVVICAEFIANEDERIRKFLCGSLGATMLIVPSYSRGEQDFINELSSLKGYGTTVIWGNCCGAATGKEKAIGGCGIAGTTETVTFGSACQCGFSCKNVLSCIFKIKIPLNYEHSKIKQLTGKENITHEIIYREKQERSV